MRGTGLIILAGLIATPALARSGPDPVALEKATPPQVADVVVRAGGAVPLPRARPPVPAKTSETGGPAPAGPPTFEEIIAGLDIDPATITSAPTLCDERLKTMAKITLKPRLIGPGGCGGPDLVQVDAVLLPDKSAVRLHPAPMLQCRMAESLASWLREEAAPRLARLGSPLRAVENWDAYECRSRNRVDGARLSEHARGNAIDLRHFQLADGRKITLTDLHADVSLRESLRDTACARFTTVLGPGAPYHGEHIHLDVIQRSNGYRICHWDVLEPAPTPLPRPRPAEVASAAPAKAEPANSDPPVPKGTAAVSGSGASTRAKPDSTVVAMIPAGAGTADAGAAGAKDAEPGILHIKPRRGAASRPDAAAGKDGAKVPLPAPKPASLAEATPAPKASRVRHRKHRNRRPPYFHFPFIPWR